MTVNELIKILERQERNGNGNKEISIDINSGSDFVINPRMSFDNRKGGLVLVIF